jgi:hypothetical protein
MLSCVLPALAASTSFAQSASNVPPRTSYRLDVVPILSKAGCNTGACHGNAQGKGGFRLSLRGDDPLFDWQSITHDTLARRINATAPSQSLLLLKPSGQVAHEGGLRFQVDSEAYQTLKSWIDQGAVDDEASAPKLVRILVTPSERLVPASETNINTQTDYRQQLRVEAEFADGTRRDVTHQATYEISDPSLATVTEQALVIASRAVEVAVSARYLEGRATSRLAFLANHPNFAWSGPQPVNFIDEHVFAKLNSLRINPSARSSDEVFLRRVYLDTLGVLPSADEARAFLTDPSPEKRPQLIEKLLTREELADFWALKWADLLRNEEKTMGPKGVWIFQRWLRDQMAHDVPFDQFTRTLLTTRGSTWRNPAASFFRVNRDPQTCAETVGQVFLGARLQCARCHNHPFDFWTQDDYYGFAAGFANIDRKQIDNRRRDSFDKHEINGDEIIFLSGDPKLRQPRSGVLMSPTPLGAAPLKLLPDDSNALDDLATAVTTSRQFARVLANRIWFHLNAQGIVDPVDDFRDSNPPSNPALLEALTDHFLQGGLRLRPLMRAILNSQTYQLASEPNETNLNDETNFSHARARLLPAEVLLDSLAQGLGVEQGSRRAFRAARAAQTPVVDAGNTFLKTFGKPDRLLTCECERSETTTLAQALVLINGKEIRQALDASSNRIGTLIDSNANDSQILEELYLGVLSRFPNEPERTALLRHVANQSERRKGWEDVAWALLNSKEFLLRH